MFSFSSILGLLQNLLVSFKSKSLKREYGQGMVEYALILVLIAVAVIIVLTLVGHDIKNVFSNIASSIQ